MGKMRTKLSLPISRQPVALHALRQQLKTTWVVGGLLLNSTTAIKPTKKPEVRRVCNHYNVKRKQLSLQLPSMTLVQGPLSLT